MKWFIILAVVVGLYYCLLMSATGMVLGQTQGLANQYQQAAATADQIASSGTQSNR